MLKINNEPIEEMIADAVKSFPDECCGFMFGKEEFDNRTISMVNTVRNSKEGDKRRRFEITPLDYMSAERYADENDLLLLGIYHSHPNHPSIPSEHDRIAAQIYFSYVIISVREKEFNSIQSWRLNDTSKFEEEQII